MAKRKIAEDHLTLVWTEGSSKLTVRELAFERLVEQRLGVAYEDFGQGNLSDRQLAEVRE